VWRILTRRKWAKGPVDLQHDALKLLMNGNHIKKIRSPRTILDLGTGTGAWAAEIAHEFATADEVVGVDTRAVTQFDYPANCRFEVCPQMFIADRRPPMYAPESGILITTFHSCTHGS
jgi:hypothetical protein